jgi:hypothetical protein
MWIQAAAPMRRPWVGGLILGEQWEPSAARAIWWSSRYLLGILHLTLGGHCDPNELAVVRGRVRGSA